MHFPTAPLPIVKKTLLVFVLAAILLYLVPTQDQRWFNNKSTELVEQYGTTSGKVNNADWGLMGKRVKQMSDWANKLMRHPRLDSQPLTTALLEQFPWLKGAVAMYIPWKKDRVEASKSYPATGMVLCASNNNFHHAAHLIASLRDVLGSTIPIEIAYAGDADLDPARRGFLQQFGDDIEFIDLVEFFPKAEESLVSGGSALRPFAMLASKSRRTMLVNADTMFLSLPDRLFEEVPGLVETGTLLFHDRALTGATNGDEGLVFLKEQIERAGRAPSRFLQNESLYFKHEMASEVESGLVAMDKTRPEVFMALVFAAWMNARPVRDEVTHKFFHGGTETFWIAPELSGANYFVDPLYAGTIGSVDVDKICSVHSVHADHTGTFPLWMNGGVYSNKKHKNQGYADMTYWWPGHSVKETKPRIVWSLQGNVPCIREEGITLLKPEQAKRAAEIVNVAQDVDDWIHRHTQW